jgi:hypothetical protein
MTIRIACATLVVFASLASEPALARIWTDASGKFTVEAELVEVRDGKLHLKKSGGAVVVVSRDQLSAADRNYLDALDRAGKTPPVAAKTPAAAGKTAKLKTGRAEIERALGQRVKSTFAKTPLRDALRQLADQQGIEVFVDQKSLDRAGVAADAPVSAAGASDSLEQALNNLLEPRKLAWLVRDDVLLVTSAATAEELLETRVYKVPAVGGPGPTVQDRLASGVEPKSWADNGGRGTMAPWPYGLALVVSQTYAVHRQIERQFAKLLKPLRAVEAKAAPPAGGRQAQPAALDQPTDCHFVKTPLRDVAAFFARRHGAGISIDEAALRKAGMAADAPVTAEVRDVRLASALDLVLSQVGLTWTADAKGLRITTPEAADRVMVAVEYDLHDLRGLAPADATILADVLQNMVDPPTWADNGGEGTVVPLRSAIQVRQTYRVHRQIEQLLADLRQTGKR